MKKIIIVVTGMAMSVKAFALLPAAVLFMGGSMVAANEVLFAAGAAALGVVGAVGVFIGTMF